MPAFSLLLTSLLYVESLHLLLLWGSVCSVHGDMSLGHTMVRMTSLSQLKKLYLQLLWVSACSQHGDM